MFSASLADPNLAFLLLIVGALGLYWELHAPGFFLPGLLGVLLILMGAYGLYQDSPSWYGAALLAMALLLLGVELKFYTHMISGIAGSILLALGAVLLVQGPHKISPGMGIGVSLAFGIITIFLGFLGMRARKSKRLTGLESMVGEIGVSRTEIDLRGTVLVRGEYWQARSDHRIPAGQRVRVERAEDLIVYVKEA